MAEIFDFTKRRLEKNQPVPKTIDELAQEAQQFVLADWEKMAKNNRLNDYFKSSLPNLIDPFSKANFMADLNEIANLERKLEFFTVIMAPGVASTEQIGYVVQFKIGREYAYTPELASEAYARCFSILMYLRLKHAAIEHGLIS